MTNQDNRSKDAADLRQKAEALVREQAARTPEDSAALSPEEIRKTLHELRVHQIELEMQNEELRTAQAEIEAGRARYFDLYDLAPVGYCTLSEKGLILEANLTAAALLDVPRGTLVNQPISRFIHKEDQDIYYLHRKKLFETGETQECELRLVKPDGASFWGHLKATAAQAADGAPVCRVVISDITERFELDQRKQQIAKAESLSLMAGALAHHFNNMLSIVIGNLELTMNDLTAGSPNQEHLSEAMEGARRAAEISTIMLTFTGQLQKKTGVRDLADITNGIVSELRHTFPRRIRIQNELSVSSRLFVNIDIDLIRQALAHLVTNALEAIEEDSGEVRVSIGTMQGEEISRTAAWPPDWKPGTGAYAVLEVSDTGEGIPAHNTGKVMDPFFSTKFTGRGIGLPVVLGIAQVHGGGIQFQSKSGSGSVFRMLFPLLDKKTQADQKTATESFVSSKPAGLVLLVEDEEIVRNTMGAILRRLGFDVLAAKDGGEALEIFRRRPEEIRLVITDLTMSGMNGWNTIAALRKIRPEIPVILASGYDNAHVMASDHAEKPQAFLHKPFETETLRKTLERVLGLDRIRKPKSTA
jgi:two-component system, cell cycle sensor histidine kinase and response regulator CckA